MKLLLLSVLLGTATLARADAVRLQINGPDGKPVAGAQVRVQESSGRWPNFKREAPLDLTSDANGAVTWESKGSLAPRPDGKPTRDAQAYARVMAPGLAVGGANLKAGDNLVTLGEATTLQGVVADENQKPIVGARLTVESIFVAGKGNDEDAQFLPLRDALALEAVTDGRGQWRLEQLPMGVTVRFKVAAPGFQNLNFPLPTAEAAPPIFLQRGATVVGRILRPDGSPAPDVQFFAADYADQPRTDANGRFEVNGLKPGSVMLQILGGGGDNLPFKLSFKPVQGLRAGEVRDVGDWQGEKGVRVKGFVMDGANKPVAGARVSVWGQGDGNGETDAKGAFDFVAKKGASMSTVYAAGFVQKVTPNVPDAKNGVVELGTITLKRGLKITGVLKNQAGTPLPNIYLQATRNGNQLGSAMSNAKGEFNFDGLEVGPYKIQSYDSKIVTGERFVVAPAGNKPLAVVIAGEAPAREVRGVPLKARVFDENGAPVVGAQVALKLQMGESYSRSLAISDANGALTGDIRGAGETLKVTEVFRPGYAAGTSDLKLEDGAWRGQVRLQTRGTALRGRVVNADGKPAAKIAVALAGGTDLPVATDEKGEFALIDAPQSGVTILASDGARLASFEVKKSGQKIEIQLPDVTPVDKDALVEVVVPRARWEWGLLENWDAFGAARMETLVLSMRRDANDSWTWNQFLQTLARREPARFVARESELRAHNTTNNDQEFDNYARLAYAVAGDEAQKSAVREWLETERKIKRETTSGNVGALLTRAEIAAALGDKAQTRTWLDYAAQLGDYVPDRSNQAWEWGARLARIAPDAALVFAENWTPVAQMQILQTALMASAKLGDADAARADWERILALSVAAENGPPDTKTRIEGFVLRASAIAQQARGTYAQLLSRTDPKAAFELAKVLSPDGSEQMETMPIIGENAVKLGQFDIARQALRATFETNLGNTESNARAAQLAATFDDELAAELFERLYEKIDPASREGRPGNSMANYAAARADKWPGETRILIEREWPGALVDARKESDDNFDEEGRTAIQLVGALARVAPTRAVEMAEQLPERKQLRAKAYATILSALL